MGALLGKCGVSTAVVVECDAPARFFWNTLWDVANYDKFLSMVKSVRILKNARTTNSSEAVGTRWTETRVYPGVEYELHNTLTAANEDTLTASIGVDFAPSTREVRNASCTSTMAIQSVSETSCLVVGTWAFVGSSNPFNAFQCLFCRPCLVRRIKASMQQEIEEFGAEARRRYLESIQKKPE